MTTLADKLAALKAKRTGGANTALAAKTTSLATAATAKAKESVEKTVSVPVREAAKAVNENLKFLEVDKSALQLDEFNYQRFQDCMYELYDKINEDLPLQTVLRTINNDLRDQPKLAHMLSDEQRGLVVNGILKVKKVEIAPKAKAKAKPKAKVTKKDLLSIGADDLDL